VSRLGQARGPGAVAMTNFFHVLNMRCMYKIDRRGGESFFRKLPNFIQIDETLALT